MAMHTRSWALLPFQSVGVERHLILPRGVAGLPLVLIGLAHVFDPTAPMRPLIEAAGLPGAAILSPVAVTAEIIAGASLLLGLYTRLGALIAIPTMMVAIYAHLAIDVWPNPNEPPLALPVIVLVSAGYVLARGGGLWSLDRRLAFRKANPNF